MATHNKTLGRFHLTGIPAAPRGLPQIEVAFDLDANGIVNVSAKDLGTGTEQQITITSSSGLDKGEVERMVHDAKSHAEEDLKAREAADVRNKADQLVYQVAKTLEENQAKFSDEDKRSVEEALGECRSALEGGEADKIQAATERLEKASHRLAEVIYKEAGAHPPGAEGPAGGPGAPAADDVIDAEVVNADEGNKN